MHGLWCYHFADCDNRLRLAVSGTVTIMINLRQQHKNRFIKIHQFSQSNIKNLNDSNTLKDWMMQITKKIRLFFQFYRWQRLIA